MKWIFYTSFLLAWMGALDAGYLTYEHYSNSLPPCSTSLLFLDCGKVLKSQYSNILGFPLALIGFVHYAIEIGLIFGTFILKKRFFRYFLVIFSTIGFISSLYFVYLQLFVINAICFYCMISALISTLLFVTIQRGFPLERKQLLVFIFHHVYKLLIRRFFFLIDSEIVHDNMTRSGQLLGKLPLKPFFNFAMLKNEASLKQTIAGIAFENPVGLAAGFDYEARLTQVTPLLGFGFQTIGTITNHPYEGNPRPQLGRLPKSKSLMVNKGFRNLGAKKTIEKLEDLQFAIPIGISIGRTNTMALKTQKQSVEDIVSAFKLFEKSRVNHAYYELNISCPNLFGDITFYPTQNLEQLLIAVDQLKLTRPLFIKMPIEKNNTEVLSMLKTICKHKVTGVIFGNLQKNRQHHLLDQNEVAKYTRGNFSGKPTFERSNELIALTYKYYKKRLIIIGCGGVFTPQDAYTKIALGASLVQLITGMIFEGPQLAAAINLELPQFLEKDGFTHISQAIGSKN